MRAKADLRDAQQRTVTALYEGIWVDPAKADDTAGGAILPMGAGKTASALTAFQELQRDNHARDMFVLAPKRVAQLVWRAEVKHWAHLQHLRVVFVGGSLKQREAQITTPADVYCIGVDNAQWFVDWMKRQNPRRFERSVLCIDELSRFKNPRGKRLRALAPMMASFLARWGLTGTPRPNGYEDLFGPVKLLTKGKLWGKSFDQWREQRFYPLDFHRHKWAVLPEAQQRIIDDANQVFITMRPEDMPDLPDLNDGPEFIEWVDLPDEIIGRYKEMQRHLINELKSKGGGELVIAANQAVASGKLAQICQGFLYDGIEGRNRGIERFHDLKMDRLLELIEEAGGEPIMVAYEFQADLDNLKQNFPGLKWLGAGVKDSEAEEFERAWNRGDLDVAAVHPASAGHGLNLQFGGSQLFHYGLTWSSELYDQLLKRFHRPGQHRAVWSRPILARAPGLYTVDQMKYDRVHDKMTAQQIFQRLIKEL
jgi:SNF2 family DNA or RNA helicase